MCWKKQEEQVYLVDLLSGDVMTLMVLYGLRGLRDLRELRVLRGLSTREQEPIFFNISLYNIQPMGNVLHMNTDPTNCSQVKRQRKNCDLLLLVQHTGTHPHLPSCLHLHHPPSFHLNTTASCSIMQAHAGSRSTTQQRSTTQHHAIPRNTTQYHAIPRNITQHHATSRNITQLHSDIQNYLPPTLHI